MKNISFRGIPPLAGGDNYKIKMIMLSTVLCALSFFGAQADEPAPLISDLNIVSSNLDLTISNISTGGTYTIERTSDLVSSNWSGVYCFSGLVGTTNWSDVISGTSTSAFYRVKRETNHEKVGEVATLVTRYHGVTGTVHIVNNCTIELRNFYFDGAGIDVVVFVSPNPYPSFSGGTSISGNLVGPPFVNETLQFTLPEGFDLSLVSYVSIWCIDIPVSFGDGQFQ